MNDDTQKRLEDIEQKLDKIIAAMMVSRDPVAQQKALKEELALAKLRHEKYLYKCACCQKQYEICPAEQEPICTECGDKYKARFPLYQIIRDEVRL